MPTQVPAHQETSVHHHHTYACSLVSSHTDVDTHIQTYTYARTHKQLSTKRPTAAAPPLTSDPSCLSPIISLLPHPRAQCLPADSSFIRGLRSRTRHMDGNHNSHVLHATKHSLDSPRATLASRLEVTTVIPYSGRL